ncbi:MAG: hypothetical protein ACM362_12485 [Candidatus Methylomirabilota bacterium]
MGWMELIDDYQVFLIRLETDVWAEIEHGTLMSLDLLRPGERERRPRFQQGDVLLLYHPQTNLPDSPPAELSHVVAVRSELSNDTGYGLGPVYRVVPPLTRERLLFASQRGILPDVFRRVDDRTFTFKLLTSDQRNQFVEYVLNAGIRMEIEEGKGGRPETEPVGERPGVVEYEL